LDSSYYLELITVERNSCLLYHLHKAWVGARIRAALAASAAPGANRIVSVQLCIKKAGSQDWCTCHSIKATST
jgi:hypothetical protein